MGAEELVDIVDEEDVVVGVAPRWRMRAERLRHRATYVIVQRSDGAVLVHRRAEDKDLWPGRWDLCVGGVVTAGESYDSAARRELAEEVGIDQPASLEAVGHGAYEDDDVAMWGQVYRAVHDGPLAFTDGEVVEARWIAPGELAGFVATHEFVPDSPALAVPFVVRGPIAGPNARAPR